MEIVAVAGQGEVRVVQLWPNAALLDEVLERTDSRRRLQSMRVLVGLLEPVSGGATESWRLHPLVREHCAGRLFRENPQRFRAIHRRIAEARKLFREVAATRPAHDNADRDADFEYAMDDGIVRGVMALYGGVSMGSVWFRTLSSDYARFAESQRLDPLTHGFMEYGLCVIYQLKAEFGPALKRLAGARQVLEQSPYMMMYGQLLRGQVALAQGQVQEAESHYRTAQRNVPSTLLKYGVSFSSFATASDRFEEGRVLARELIAVAIDRRLRRTQMRALALSVVLEQRAGEPESAVGHLQEFLSLFAESPYAWPLVRERADCAKVVTRFLDLNPGSPYRETARSLLAAMRGVDHGRRLVLSERERDVLRRLEGQRDKQIAAELGLTVTGVRRASLHLAVSNGIFM